MWFNISNLFLRRGNLMERTWKPTTAGVLSIVVGVFGLIEGIVVASLSGVLSSFPWFEWGAWAGGYDIQWIIGAVGVVGAVLIVLGVVAIVGGVFALQRRIWGLALAGAICALIVPPGAILGILSIIFVAMGRREFVQS